MAHCRGCKTTTSNVTASTRTTNSPRLRWDAVAHAVLKLIRWFSRPSQSRAPAHTSTSKNSAAA